MNWLRPTAPVSPWVALLAPWAGQWVVVNLRGTGCCLQLTGRLKLAPDGLHAWNTQGETLVRWDDVLCVTQVSPQEQDRLTLDAMTRATEGQSA